MADDVFMQIAKRFPAGAEVRIIGADGTLGAMLDSPLAAPVYGTVLRITADAIGTPMIGVFLGGIGTQFFRPEQLERGHYERVWVNDA